jgi:hypothetical protein
MIRVDDPLRHRLRSRRSPLIHVSNLSRCLLGTALSLAMFSASEARPLVETYTGVAKNKKGEVVYRERHVAEFDEEGRILRAKTDYLDVSGEVIGVMESDFTAALTAPDYSYRDLRDGSEHGIRVDAGEFVLFKKNPDGSEETRRIESGDFDEGTLLVGCQGLHYYLIDHLEEVENRKKIPIMFLIPGKLDAYAFTMYHRGEKDGVVDLEIKISNFLLRLFAPKLDIRYREADRRLLRYFGLSNIATDDGKLQTVSIEYQYE